MINATLNHELRNPLNVMILMLDELHNRSQEFPQISNIIKTCRSSANFLFNLVDQMIEYYQITQNVDRDFYPGLSIFSATSGK